MDLRHIAAEIDRLTSLRAVSRQEALELLNTLAEHIALRLEALEIHEEEEREETIADREADLR